MYRGSSEYRRLRKPCCRYWSIESGSLNCAKAGFLGFGV